MAQFDANVDVRVNVEKAERQLKKFQDKFKKAKQGELFFDSDNRAAARTQRKTAEQILNAQKEALRIADAKVKKDLQLAAALQRQETLQKAINRAGGPNSQAAKGRIDAAIAASKEAKRNVGIQQAVNNLLVKELQIRREINRVANASNAAKSVGNRRGREIRGFKLPAAQEQRLLKLNAAYVTAAEKGQADIAKAINRKIETELKGLRKIAATRKRDQKKADADAQRGITKRENAEKRAAAKRKRDRSKLTDNIGAAAGFPLLFGGGAGSVVGGVAGAGIGSLLGAGFGVSILGSALGQAFDKLATAALDTAKAFDNVADNLDVVLKKLGESNSTIGARAGFLSNEGFTNQAASAVRQRAVETLGNAEVQRLQQLAVSAREFDKALERLGLTFQGWISGIVKGAADLISGTQPKPESTAEQKAIGSIRLQESKIKVLETAEELAKARGGALSAADQKRLKTYRDQLAVLKEQVLTVEGATESERILLDLSRKRLQTLKEIGQAEVSVAERALTERRDVLAGDKGDIAVRKAQSEVDRIRGEIDANVANGGAGSVARALQLQKELNEALAKLGVARATASNNVLKAERQITAEQAKLFQNTLNAQSQTLSTINQIRILEGGITGTYATRIKDLGGIQENERKILASKQAQELVTVREGEIMDELLKKQEQERQLLDNRQYLILRQAAAQDAAARDRQQALIDTRELVTLEAQLNAERLKRATDPSYMMSFAGAGLGFFSDSSKLEADQIAERAAQLERFNVQVADLQKRLTDAKANKADFTVIDGLEQRILDVKNLRKNYAELQPEIDAAALAQARFNDAFAVVSPVVNSIVNGLKEVVAGTKTAEEALADLINNVADLFLQRAAEMLAQALVLKAIGLFGMGGGGGGDGDYKLEGGGLPFGGSGNAPSGLNTQIFGRRADGGPVGKGNPYIVGERGPELFVPSQSGTVISNEESRQAMSYYGGGSGGGTFKLETTVINGVEYATVDQVRAMGSQAARQGAAGGNAMTMNQLRNSRSQRSKLGMS